MRKSERDRGLKVMEITALQRKKKKNERERERAEQSFIISESLLMPVSLAEVVGVH